MMFLLLRHAGTKQKQIIKSLIKINLCPAEKKARIKNTKPENAEENWEIMKNEKKGKRERDLVVFRHHVAMDAAKKLSKCFC